jgi:hypothetical protein
MSLEERYKLFGDPSASLAPEAVWVWHYEREYWPNMTEATEKLMSIAELSQEEAEQRLLEAIQNEEVIARLDEGEQDFFLSLDEDTSNAIARRYLDLTMPRRDREETW